MVAYSFQGQFVVPIIEGSKRQTIRAVGRRRHATPGCSLQLYTAMRTKHCRAIGTALCRRVDRVELAWRERHVVIRHATGATTTIYPPGFDEFARTDGFVDGAALAAFWDKTHGPVAYQFSGVLVRWCHFEAAA